jgi:hypothetical protein
MSFHIELLIVESGYHILFPFDFLELGRSRRLFLTPNEKSINYETIRYLQFNVQTLPCPINGMDLSYFDLELPNG